jgi:succinyl-CoA:acetate CoA-transferase
VTEAKLAEVRDPHMRLGEGPGIDDETPPSRGSSPAPRRAGVLARRLPFQSDPVLRKAINAGEVMFIDQHLSETVELLRSRQIVPIDIAVLEAVAITAEGGIIPTTSIGNSATFGILAEKIIIEINLTQPLDLEEIQDVYIPTRRPFRQPIPIVAPESRVGLPFIPIDPAKVVAVVVTKKLDSASMNSASIILPPDSETRQIAGHLIEFLSHEVEQGRLSLQLQPLQAGIGTIANGVLHGMIDSPFHGLKMYSEVLQDSAFDLFDAGILDFASCSSITVPEAKYHAVVPAINQYKSRLILRPQEISNHPEVIRRLGLICINTALECDIYGNINFHSRQWHPHDERDLPLRRFCPQRLRRYFRHEVTGQERPDQQRGADGHPCRSQRARRGRKKAGSLRDFEASKDRDLDDV